MRDELLAGRNAYNYPTVGLSEIDGILQHLDFDSSYSMDSYHYDLLHSVDAAEKVIGYLSVVYWGFFSGQDGIARPERAMSKVQLALDANFETELVNQVINAAINNINGQDYGRAIISLTALPQLGFAFAAKVCAFLNPDECGVADSVIAENFPEFNFAMNANNVVRTNNANAASYQAFCVSLQQRRDYMNEQGLDYRWTDGDGQTRTWRAIDIERALFAP